MSSTRFYRKVLTGTNKTFKCETQIKRMKVPAVNINLLIICNLMINEIAIFSVNARRL